MMKYAKWLNYTLQNCIGSYEQRVHGPVQLFIALDLENF